MHIILITYMRETEKFNKGMEQACSVLKEIDPALECIYFTDKPRKLEVHCNIKMRNIVYPGTKYVRLLKILEEEQNCLYVSIDNDVQIDIKLFEKYIAQCIDENIDCSWARLMAQDNKSLISKLVAVDKLLSHNLIRPFLWKMKIGLSIPGQCFVINSKAFKKKLYEFDTFLDDLALGAYISENYENLKVLISSSVIGYEFPNETFEGLCKQRKRWAKGYYQVLKEAKGKDFFGKVCIHGIAYHGIWLLHWAVFFMVLRFSITAAMIYILIISGVTTYKSPRYYIWSIIYQIVFPIFHIIWFYNVIKEKIKDNMVKRGENS